MEIAISLVQELLIVYESPNLEMYFVNSHGDIVSPSALLNDM
jgi:hypothetical protein